jgi:flavin-dependent thymidylate synthase
MENNDKPINKLCKIQDLTDEFNIKSIDDFKTGYCEAVVSSARASFNKQSNNYTQEQNNKLVDYLKTHNHKSPFFHAQMVFVLPTVQWQNFILFVMENNANGLLHQDDLSSVQYYTNTTGENDIYGNEKSFTYIKISSWFLQRFCKYIEHFNLKLYIGLGGGEKVMKQWFFDYRVNHKWSYYKDNANFHLLLFPFNPSNEWLENQDNVLEASRMVNINLLIEAPLFVVRQLDKHRKAEKNERSGRYVKFDLEFYQPDEWRKKSDTNKQGSKQDEFVKEEFVDINRNYDCVVDYQDIIEVQNRWYTTQIANHMCGEQARMIMPLATMTSFLWTLSLNTLATIVKQRLHPDAQYETRLVVQEIYKIAQKRYPIFDKILQQLDHSDY